MKHNKLVKAMALSLSLALVSCGDKDAGSNQAVDSGTKVNNVSQQIASAGGIMSYIPAETPILFVYAKDPSNPLPDNFKQKMEKMYSGIGDIISMAMQDSMKKYQEKAGGEENADKAQEMMDKWMSKDGLKKMGLSLEENEFAIYAVDLFPVMRISLAQDHSITEFLDELMADTNKSDSESAKKINKDGHEVYMFGDKEVQVMISVKGNSLVGSFSPTREAEQLMPKLLGFEKPSKNVAQSNQFQDIISQYNYLSNSLYWVNIRDIADVFVNPSQYKTPLLDMMSIEDNMLSADCKTEVLEVFDKIPRLVGGYTSFDERTMSSHMALEMTDGLGSKLATMTGRIPTASGDVALSYGFSFDIAAAKELAAEFVTNIENDPYKCEFMTMLNDQAATFKARLDQPLPPFVGNFKGVNVVVNEMDLDLSQTDPSAMVKDIKAKVLLAVDNPEALKGMAEMMMPELQKLGIEAGKNAVNVSDFIPIKGSQIPINLDHVFMAMGSDTLGASLGEGTDVSLTKDVSSESTSDLFNLKISAELYKKLFSGLSDMSASLGEEMQQQMRLQKMFMSDMLWWETEAASMDFSDKGLEVTVDIEY